MLSRFTASSRTMRSALFTLGLAGTVMSSMVYGTSASATLAAASLTPASPAAVQGDYAQARASTRAPAVVRNRVLSYVARETGAPRSSLSIVSASSETWSDGCLGIPDPVALCLAALTPGWRVEVSDGNINRVYRTDATARVIKEEVQVADTSGLPRLTAGRVLDEIRRTSGVPLEQLNLVASEERTWDGCFGLPDPEQPFCTMIAIPGWRVVVEAPQHVWIYHTNQDGTELRLNKEASQQGSDVVVPQLLGYNQLPAQDEGSLFTVITSGGFTGRTEKTVLFRDGRVVRYAVAGDPASGVVVRSHSAQEVARFLEQMQLAQIDRFQGLYYPAPAGAADYRTVTLLPGTYGAMQYDDIVADRLPDNLQQVMQIWESFTRG